MNNRKKYFVSMSVLCVLFILASISFSLDTSIRQILLFVYLLIGVVLYMTLMRKRE